MATAVFADSDPSQNNGAEAITGEPETPALLLLLPSLD